MNDRCVLCAARGEDAHHPTGRGADGRYLDPRLAVGGCHDHHELWHDDLRGAGIDGPVGGPTVLERLELRLRRLGLFLARVEGDGSLARLARLLAAACVRWADELDEEIRRLDRSLPGWRSRGSSRGP